MSTIRDDAEALIERIRQNDEHQGFVIFTDKEEAPIFAGIHAPTHFILMAIAAMAHNCEIPLSAIVQACEHTREHPPTSRWSETGFPDLQEDDAPDIWADELEN